jgi:hypothetical protein
MDIAKGDIKGDSKVTFLGDPAKYPNWKSAREVNTQFKSESLQEDETDAAAADSTQSPVEKCLKRYRYEMKDQ